MERSEPCCSAIDIALERAPKSEGARRLVSKGAIQELIQLRWGLATVAVEQIKPMEVRFDQLEALRVEAGRSLQLK